MTKTLIIIFFLLFGAQTSFADDKAKIVAIIGNAVVTNIDVATRVDFLKKTQNLKDLSAADDMKLKQQVMQEIINEKLFTQEATKMGLSIPPDEVKQALEGMAQQSKLTLPQFMAELQLRNIEAIVTGQVTSQMLWHKLVSYRIKPTVEVTNNEVMEVIEHNSQDYQVSFKQILLEEGEKLESGLRDASATINSCQDFDAVLLQFKQTVPEIITSPLSELQPEIAKIVQSLPVGKAVVAKTSSGMHFIALCSKDKPLVVEQEQAKVKEVLLQRKLERAANKFLAELRKRYYIEFHPENL
jgi:hypothetical protein